MLQPTHGTNNIARQILMDPQTVLTIHWKIHALAQQ